MMKLWGGRFTKETNQLVHNFNASLSFDQKFYKQDIDGSIAHVNMLAKQGIVTNEERLPYLTDLKALRVILKTVHSKSARNMRIYTLSWKLH